MSILIAVLMASGTAAGPQPLNRADWVKTEDYPADFPEAYEGRVGVKLEIDIAGNPSECSVTVSSGNAKLDEYTCSLLTSRARFTPAHTADGQPSIGIYRQAIHWSVPRDPLVSLFSMVSYRVDEATMFSDCRIENRGTDEDEVTCDEPAVRRLAQFALGKSAGRYASVGMEFAQIVEGSQADLKDILPEGAENHIIAEVRLVIAVDGKVAGCKATVAEEFEGSPLDMCMENGQIQFRTYGFEPDGHEHTVVVRQTVFGVPR